MTRKSFEDFFYFLSIGQPTDIEGNALLLVFVLFSNVNKPETTAPYGAEHTNKKHTSPP